MIRMRGSFLVGLALVFGAVSPIDAQPVLLQIRPHVGDTIALSVEQRLELTGGTGEATRRMTTVTQVFSRAIVTRSTSRGSDVTAITDSIRTATFTSGRAPALKRAQVKDPVMKLRVSADG